MPVKYNDRIVQRLSNRVVDLLEKEGSTHSDLIAQVCDFPSARHAAWFVKKHMKDRVEITQSTHWRYNLEFRLRGADD